jgi:hypothetical protein
MQRLVPMGFTNTDELSGWIAAFPVFFVVVINGPDQDGTHTMRRARVNGSD